MVQHRGHAAAGRGARRGARPEAPFPAGRHLIHRMFVRLFHKMEVILNAASVWQGGGPTRNEGSRGMQGRRPETNIALTGCFDCVPSTASAHDGTPLSMTSFF